MDLELLSKIKKEVLSIPFVEKETSQDFAGVYLHSNKSFTLEDHEAAIHSFFVFSNYSYPLYLFVSPDSVTDDISFLINKYENIKFYSIPKFNSIIEYSDFLSFQLPYLLDHENLVYIHPDGFIIKDGWEEKTINYSYIGSKWKSPVKVIENTFNFPAIQIGNGIGFRKRSGMIKVLNLLDKYGGRDKIVKGIEIDGKIRNVGSFLAEDLLFCFFGFGAGIFEPVDLDWIDSFAREPIEYKDYLLNPKPCHFYHRCDQ